MKFTRISDVGFTAIYRHPAEGLAHRLRANWALEVLQELRNEPKLDQVKSAGRFNGKTTASCMRQV
jgi:hypothetical protein